MVNWILAGLGQLAVGIAIGAAVMWLHFATIGARMAVRAFWKSLKR
jgi:hypothetical protein